MGGQKQKNSKSQESAAFADEAEMLPVEPEEAVGQLSADLGPVSEAPQPVEADGKRDDGFQAPPDPGLSALEKLIAASSEYPDQDHVPVPEPALGNLITLPTEAQIEAIENGDFTQMKAALSDESVTESIRKIRSQRTAGTALGPQANGDYGVVVVIKEAMVSGVLGQAEMDGVSPTEWMSTRLGEYLEQWFFGR